MYLIDCQTVEVKESGRGGCAQSIEEQGQTQDSDILQTEI